MGVGSHQERHPQEKRLFDSRGPPYTLCKHSENPHSRRSNGSSVLRRVRKLDARGHHPILAEGISGSVLNRYESEQTGWWFASQPSRAGTAHSPTLYVFAYVASPSSLRHALRFRLRGRTRQHQRPSLLRGTRIGARSVGGSFAPPDARSRAGDHAGVRECWDSGHFCHSIQVRLAFRLSLAEVGDLLRDAGWDAGLGGCPFH